LNPADPGQRTHEEIATVDKQTFSTSLRQTLEAELTLGHPIFKELFAEQRNWTLLRMITLEGYQITKYFLEYIENLFFYCPIPEHKRRLLFNLFEEETGRFSKTKNHVELMEDFIRAQGISDQERDAHRPSTQTQELIDYRLQAVKGRATYHIGAAAVMIASEGQSLETRAGEARHSILGKLYGLTDQDTLFFSVHQKEDVAHVKEGIALVTDLCTTEKMQREALDAVTHTCRLFWNMYDSVAQRYWGMNSGHVPPSTARATEASAAGA
jgi:pyrroloquinoline-quinone synthase